MKKRIFVVVLIISTVLWGIVSYAVTLDDQKNAVQDDLRETRDNLDSITAEKNQVLTEVNELNNQIAEVQSELSDLQDKIKSLDDSISEKEKDLEEKQKLLDERLSVVYMKGGNTYLEALLKGGLINFFSNYDMIKQIAEYDNNLINEVTNQKEELRKEKEELENAKKQVQERENDLNNKKSEREQKVSSLTEEEQLSQSIIEAKENELAKINMAVKKAAEEAEEARRKKMAEDALNNKKNDNKEKEEEPELSSGGMAWPTRIAHKINSVYAPGGRSDTSGYYGTAHKGVDIYAPAGTPVYAAKEGTVVYINRSGYGGGWGIYVVVYHGIDSNGKPMYTRYAHASSIASGISVGSTVTPGTILMYAGSTGAAEGAHLHFEVCLGNMYSQVNPCPYLGIQNTAGTH